MNKEQYNAYYEVLRKAIMELDTTINENVLDELINICKENSITVYEKEFLMESVHSSDEAFVTGTFAGVIPAIQVDNYKISNGKYGPLTQKLFYLYKNMIKTIYSKA